MDRRQFLAGSLPVLMCAVGLLERPALAAEPGKEGLHYDRLSRGRVHCRLCPLQHVLAKGERGPCRTRKNDGGVLRSLAWENPAILKLDPVEKLPSTHFHPGTQTLTVATGGCNLRCLYCQNWQQSQARPEDLKTVDLPATEAVRRALGKEIKTLAFSYTEPVMSYEYTLAIAKAAKRKGMRVVLATGGYLRTEPLQQLLEHLDAVTIGLKAFSEDAYVRLTGRSLDPILENLQTVKRSGTWLEITNLVVPTYNDDRKMITAMCRWIRKHLGTDVPLHFGRFVPRYKLTNLPQTPLRSLEEARAIALAAGIKHAYVSNVAPHEGNHTWCPKCGIAVVKRIGFRVLEDQLDGGRCPACRTAVAGVWD